MSTRALDTSLDTRSAFVRPVILAGVMLSGMAVLYLATGLLTLGSIVGLALVPAAVWAWKDRWFTIGGRLYYSLLAVTAPIVMWWTAHWNLLGWRF